MTQKIIFQSKHDLFTRNQKNIVSNTPQTLNVAEISVNWKRFMWDVEQSFNQALKHTLIPKNPKTNKQNTHTDTHTILIRLFYCGGWLQAKGEIGCAYYIIIPSLD